MKKTVIILATVAGVIAVGSGIGCKAETKKTVKQKKTTPKKEMSKPDLSKIHGKIQFVTSFPDYKVKVVNSFPDLKVQKVTSFPDSAGKWEIVTSFPDYKIQIVDSFPDFKIEYVTSFPGVN